MGTLVRICREGEPKTFRGTVLLIIKDGKNTPAFVVQTNVKTLLNVAWEGQVKTAPIKSKNSSSCPLELQIYSCYSQILQQLQRPAVVMHPGSFILFLLAYLWDFQCENFI